MIELDHVEIRYGDFVALDDLSLTVRDGECLALVGPSGSGKTSALRAVNGMAPRAGGTVSIDGRSIDDWDPSLLRRSIGYVIQDVGLLPHWSVERNIGTVPAMLGWSRREMAERARSLIVEVGLDESALARLPSELSGGQRQRVGIARALAANPRWVLMDEPFGAVDPLTRSRLRELFVQLRTARSMTTVLVTHDLEDAFYLADRLAILRRGKLVRLGDKHDVLAAPEDEWVREFVAAGTRSKIPPAEASPC